MYDFFHQRDARRDDWLPGAFAVGDLASPARIRPLAFQTL